MQPSCKDEAENTPYMSTPAYGPISCQIFGADPDPVQRWTATQLADTMF